MEEKFFFFLQLRQCRCTGRFEPNVGVFGPSVGQVGDVRVSRKGYSGEEGSMQCCAMVV